LERPGGLERRARLQRGRAEAEQALAGGRVGEREERSTEARRRQRRERGQVTVERLERSGVLLGRQRGDQAGDLAERMAVRIGGVGSRRLLAGQGGGQPGYAPDRDLGAGAAERGVEHLL
jgi:hypothetical protein